MSARNRNHEIEHLFAKSIRLIQLSRCANRRLDSAADALGEILRRQAASAFLVGESERSVDRPALDRSDFGA